MKNNCTKKYINLIIYFKLQINLILNLLENLILENKNIIEKLKSLLSILTKRKNFKYYLKDRQVTF